MLKASACTGFVAHLNCMQPHGQKEQGMTELAFSVDSQNLSGATHEYEDCGFQVVKRNAVYSKAQ